MQKISTASTKKMARTKNTDSKTPKTPNTPPRRRMSRRLAGLPVSGLAPNAPLGKLRTAINVVRAAHRFTGGRNLAATFAATLLPPRMTRQEMRDGFVAIINTQARIDAAFAARS